MKKLIYNVSAKEMTVIDCVKLLPNKNYEDTIKKDFEYTGETTKTISFRNFCAAPFTIPEKTLFTDVTNGGNFTAKVSAFTIGSSQEINIQVKYFGIYKGDNVKPNYNIQLNGIQAIYTLNVTVPVVNTPPETQDILISLDNGEAYVFKIEDFLARFKDLDGDDLDAVIISGDTSLYTYKGVALVSGETIPRIDIINKQLTIKSQNTIEFIDNGTLWQAVDTRGGISS